ncbi:membrane-associated protein, putative [Bodo saltans]|uniref:Membrane-associated protein, putative n=1 Tax=Bodo saltans TaxID=75058 RepID=A0A0S4IZY4_BODSA|nr:membrane-associated protein, putative [Bodo saltans]|eukprot:CUG31328.1 membrane-associated protein, putative [Bodo saltans]
MAPVEKRPKGLSPLLRVQLLYRAPFLAYYFFVIMMILLTLLAWCNVPDASGEHLEKSAEVVVQLEAIKQHMMLTAPGTKRPFFARVFLYHVLNGLYHLALHLGLNFQAVRAICAAAWAAHVFETIHAYRLCRKCKASTLTTSVYLFATFLGGFGQLLPLKQAVLRYEEELEKRGQ